MKNVKKLLGIALLMTLLTVKVAYANELRWEDLPGHHNQSILLNDELLLKTSLKIVPEADFSDSYVRNTK